MDDPVEFGEARQGFRDAVVRLLVARRQAGPGASSDDGPYGEAMDELAPDFGWTRLQEAVDALASDYDACGSDEQRAALLSRYSRS